MPTIFILYLFNYLDRNNIAQAKLDSFSKGLGLKGNNYRRPYILMQLPSNMILTKVRPSLYIPFWVCIWACVSAATAGTHNFGGLIGVRLVLGKELAFRYSFLYSGPVLATATSGLLAAAIFAGLGGAHGLPGWRWLFIIEGAVTLVCGVLALFLLPGLPGQHTGSARWLFNEEEQQLAVNRMKSDAVSNQEDNTSLRHCLRLAVTDIKMWMFALIMCSSQSIYGFNYFYPSIVDDRRKERGFHVLTPVLVAIVSFVISVATLNIPVRYFASFLYISGIFGANAVVFSWAATTVSDTAQKKACAMAVINITGQMGSVWSPFFFHDNEAPRYITAMILLLAFAVLEFVLLCLS
ncbi:major facilitator superfamily domain-containing protein [Aspergillus californicus]